MEVQMRHLAALIVLFCFVAAPALARADFILEGSAGTGYQVKPSIDTKRQPTNLMLAGGWGFGEWIRGEVGLLAEIPDNDAYEFDLQVRPMLVVDPPLLPIYARLIVGVANLLHDANFAFGGALGLGGSIAGLGLFAEAAMVPRVADGDFNWILEGRAGAYYLFD
jgi:hypothetical protein